MKIASALKEHRQIEGLAAQSSPGVSVFDIGGVSRSVCAIERRGVVRACRARCGWNAYSLPCIHGGPAVCER
eukprot:11194642-Lingulodinium_polyedra.AAC.1